MMDVYLRFICKSVAGTHEIRDICDTYLLKPLQMQL